MDLCAVMSYLGVPAVVGVPALRVWLRYRLHRRAVERAAVRDLPELFRAFGADTEGPLKFKLSPSGLRRRPASRNSAAKQGAHLSEQIEFGGFHSPHQTTLPGICIHGHMTDTNRHITKIATTDVCNRLAIEHDFAADLGVFAFNESHRHRLIAHTLLQECRRQFGSLLDTQH